MSLSGACRVICDGRECETGDTGAGEQHRLGTIGTAGLHLAAKRSRHFHLNTARRMTPLEFSKLLSLHHNYIAMIMLCLSHYVIITR